MRVLCVSQPEYGHFHALVPLARAVAAAGHDVAFATAGAFCPRVEEAGFAAFPAGITLERQLDEASGRYPEARLRAGPARFESFVPRMLAGVAAPPRVADLVPVVRDWCPDLLVHDEADFASAVAAAVAGIPHVTHSIGVLRPFGMADLAAQTLAPLCEQWRVPVPPLAGLFDYLYLDVCPPSMQAPHIADVATAHPVRPVAFDATGREGLPAWAEELSDAPTVYVSLGTVFNQDPGAFSAVLAGLRDEALNVIVTVGKDGDAAALGPQPDNVRVERYIPQSLLLPYCDLAVTQAGWSTFAILGHGLPLLVLPRGANQFQTAAAAVSTGAARRLLPGELAPAAVRSEVRALLGDHGYRAAAGVVKKEIEAMPAPEQVVPVLERLAEERRPLRGAT